MAVNLMINNDNFNTDNTQNTAYSEIIKTMFIPALIKTMDSSIETTNDITSQLTDETPYYLKNNRAYQLSYNSTSKTLDFAITAISQNKYNELFSLQQTLDTTNNDTTNDISNSTSNNNYIDTDNTTNNNNEDFSSSTNKNEEEFNNDNEKAYTKYCLLFDNGETYNDIYVEIEGRNIYLYDNESEMYYSGTYTSNSGYLIGTYTEVSYNNGGNIEQETINDSFKFEILPNHKLKDILGYGQWCQQVKGKNNTFVLY